MNIVRTMILKVTCLDAFRVKLLKLSVYILNRVPNKSIFEILFLDYGHIEIQFKLFLCLGLFNNA